jgi:hypothetical protein
MQRRDYSVQNIPQILHGQAFATWPTLSIYAYNTLHSTRGEHVRIETHLNEASIHIGNFLYKLGPCARVGPGLHML